MPETTFKGCWEPVAGPAAALLADLKVGPWAAVRGDAREKLIKDLRRDDVAKPTFFVGTGTCGLGAGAAKTLAALREWVAAKKLDADVVEVGCIGLCSEEPILDVQLPGRARVSFGGVAGDVIPGLLDAVTAGRIPADRALGQFRTAGVAEWDKVAYLDEHPFLRGQRRWVLANSGIVSPHSIDEYIARGGYSALANTLRSSTPDQVCQAIEESGLRGRGGGGFPTGKKWKMARAQTGDHKCLGVPSRADDGHQKYLVCNADEGDPGAFMDRAVAESDPHRLLEGIIIGAYAIGADKAYIYIRAEYPLAIENLKKAMAQAKEYGFLGSNILDSGFSLQVVIKMGAGAFVCGEETALIHSIEGKRGMPRPRPPYPAVKGVFGKPTIINNVETLANVPMILTIGADVAGAVGTKGSKGTKVFALSGMVNRTGLVEVPMGTPIRQVVFDVGGGIPGGRKCKAVQIGGPSGGCIPGKHMDIPCDYEALKEFGAIMGSGGLVVLDENTCMVDLARFFMEFITKESCGKCIPCREGTRRLLEILEAIARSQRSEHDTDALLRFQGMMVLKELGEVIRKTSLCGLGQTAPNPVLSTLRWFRDEYEAHIFERRCPSGACKNLVGAPCQTGCPVGTEVWRYVAHTARGEYEEAYRVVRDANPFPSACARVCNHPCETRCRAGTTGGEPLAVRTLKRFIVDRVDPAVYRPVPAKAGPNAKRVAVVGGGPSGLTAAHYLSLKGHKVTVFEAEDKLGGMLTGAIPEYRLPRETLRKEIDSLLNENVEVKLGRALGRDFTVDSLLADRFDAVYLAIGSHTSKRLDAKGEDVEGVIPGIRFLKAHNLHGQTLARGRVGIVGGGNSAIDAARVAVRQKGVASVTIYYRRTEAEMPAYAEEIRAALDEGIRILPLLAPVEVLAEGGKLRAVRFRKNELGEPDASGRRRPVPVPGSEFDEPLDTLVVGIGEEPDKGALAGLAVTRKGTLDVNPESLAAGRPGVFGGGDAAAGPRTVIEAIADGKTAALMIDRYLAGKLLRLLPEVKLPSVHVAPPAEAGEADAGTARVHAPHLDCAKRTGCFSEVELSVSEEDAVREARRCMRCDLDFTRPA